MESVLDTPPSEDNAGEMCFGECKDKVEKLKRDFLILKKKIFCSQDLIKKYNNKIKESEIISVNMQTLQMQLQSTEKKLNKRNIEVKSDAVRLQIENEKLRKTREDVTKQREEYEIKIASDKQYIRQLVCKLKELEDQNLEKLMNIELEKSGLQSKVKELEREIRNLRKNSDKTDSVSPNKTNEPKKRGRKAFNTQKTPGLPVLENDLNCIDIDENVPKPLISQCDNIISQEKCQETNSANTEIQKPVHVPEIVLENEFKINVSNLEHELPKKPIYIDKNIMTDEYPNLKDDPYPLVCHKCRNLLNSRPVDEILNGMQMKPLITEFSQSPIHERNESPAIHPNISTTVETLEEKFTKLEKRVSKMKQVQNSYQNISHCSHSHVNNCCHDNPMNNSLSLMNMITTFFNTMHLNKKKKKNRIKRLKHCKKKIHRKRKNNRSDNWDVEFISCNLDNAENTNIVSGSLDTPIYTPLTNRIKKNRNRSCNTSKNSIKNSEETYDHQEEHYNNIELQNKKNASEQSMRKRNNDKHLMKQQEYNDDHSEYQKHNNDCIENQQDNDITNDPKESSNNITNIEKTFDLDNSIDDPENQIINTENINEIMPVEKLINDIHHKEKNVNYDINSCFNELYSTDTSSIKVISPSSLNTDSLQKRKQYKTKINSVSVKSNLLTRLRRLRNKSTKLPAKIFRNEKLDNVERTEELGETPAKRRRIAHVPKNDCPDNTNDNSVERSYEEQLILNRLRVTRSMVKSNLSLNAPLEKESQNSLVSEKNSNINNITNVISDYCSIEQEHQKNNENLVINKNQTLSYDLDTTEKTHLNDQENKDSDKTQGLNDKCENDIFSKSCNLDDNNEANSLEKVSQVSKVDIKTSDMLIDLEKLIENEVNEGMALENNPELSDESFVLSDQNLKKYPIFQLEPLAPPEVESEESLASLELNLEESLVPPEIDPEESLVPPEINSEESPESPEAKPTESPESPEAKPIESPESPEAKPIESPESPEAKPTESPESPGAQPKESLVPFEPEPGESLVPPELELEESLGSPEPEPEKSLESPEAKPKESLVPFIPEKFPTLSVPKHNITKIPSQLTVSNASKEPIISDKFSKTSISTNEFYKDCVINLRNRTVAISPLKTPNDNKNKSFLPNNSSQSLLDQYLAQNRPKSTGKRSTFHIEAAMKLAKGAEEYVKMELKNLINMETWTSSVNEQTINNLKMINNRSIAKSVVELLIELSNLKEPLDRTFTPPAPIMTRNQQKIVALLQKLDGLTNIIFDVLNNIEYVIFHMSSDITYEAAEELARIFTVLAKIKKDRERVRIMCCDALYCLQKKGLFILFVIITSWPEVLPSHQEDRFQYLPACISYVVKAFKHTPNDVCTKIMQLNKLIKNIYKYPDEFLTSKVFVEKLLTDLMTPGHDRSVSTAIILLSKKEGNEWTYKNIINGGLLGMIVKNKSPNVCEALKLLGYLMKSFPTVDESGTVRKIIDQLCAILDSGATSTDIQIGVVFALLSLSRHNFNRIAESIIRWQPSQSLSSELEEQINIFFNSRTLNFWKQFKKKKKSVINQIL